MNILKSWMAIAITAVIAMGCSKIETGRIVLLGDITGDPVDVIVISYLPGHSIEYHYPEVKDGKFEFSLEDVEGFADLTVSVGGVEYGARVNALDTMRMNFTVNKYGEDVGVSYDGATEKESRLWTDFYNTYLHWGAYGVAPDLTETVKFDEMVALLDRNDATFRAKYKDDFDDYYIRRAGMAHGLLKMILMEMVAGRTGEDTYDMPEYVAILDNVDPNEPDQTVFPLVYRWKSYKERDYEGGAIEKEMRFIKEYGGKITNPDVRQMLAEQVVAFNAMEIDLNSLEVYEALIDEIESFAPESASLVERIRNQIEAASQVRPGSPVPDTFLTTVDGQEIPLSSLFGKVLYIDFWATWCGPCLKEGPYFRALAEKYRDDPRISFISISTDSTDEPWLEFLDKEKPFWPQYRLHGKNDEDFSNRIGMHSIPRFILIDAEGKFIDADCARPSSDVIGQMLEEALN